MLRSLAAALLAVPLAATLAACAYNDELGRNQLLIVDDASLAQSASQAWSQTLAKSRVSRDPQANRRVDEVANRIIQAAGLGNRPWEIVVFEDSNANAFVLPGGRMGVNTGLLRLVENDDQLAAVIGHEVAHTVARHAAERYSQTAATQIGLGVATGVAGDSQIGNVLGAYGGAGAQLGILLPFSRQHELEADRLGVDYMQRAGYNPHEAVRLWQRMAQERTGGQFELASTHPSDSTRIQTLDAYIRQRGW